ncbi:unnamed protein product [Closterium sp. NIES-54]
MPPAATYTGGILGFPATAAPMDDSEEGLIASAASAGSGETGGLRRAFDASQPHVRAYAAHLVRMHSAVLAEAGVDSSAHVYSYTYAMNGVAATLSPQQVEILKRRPEVGSVREAPKYDLHTTFTPTFLNLRKRVWSNQTLQNGQKGAGQQGEDVIIGVIDTGVWRENPAFSDDVSPPYGSVPAQWKGSCMTSADFPSCNRKLIGARGFFQGLKAGGYTMDWTIDYKSARDVAGHGTHTTSTAGGNSGVAVTLNGVSFGTASGMAPRARVAMYKVFWATEENGRDNCDGSDILKAVDAAVADGVDVISLSVGRQAPLFFDDDEMIYLNAARAGVLASVSAGNSGPTTIGGQFFRSIGHPSPWMITVAASSHGRNYMTDVTVNGEKFSGRSMVGTGEGDLILGRNGVKAGGNSWMAGICASGTLDPAKVAGKIVVCRRQSQYGGWSSEDLLPMSITVKMAGAAGVVIYNTDKADRVVAVLHPIPACHLDRYTGKRLVKLLGNSTGIKASISASYVKQIAAPTVTSFSSTGPNVDPVLDAKEGGKYSFGYNDVLKPDITAPGLEVWAGWTQSPFQEPYGIASGVVPAASMSHLLISGTSMSCPHISGLAAIIKGKYPNWSPFALKSALMTTAYTLNNKNKPIYSAGQLRAADPFDYGTGHVNTFNALDPGLVYDSTVLENVKFLIAVDPVDVKQTSAYWAVEKDKRTPLNHPYDLNQPNIAVSNLRGSTMRAAMFKNFYGQSQPPRSPSKPPDAAAKFLAHSRSMPPFRNPAATGAAGAGGGAAGGLTPPLPTTLSSSSSASATPIFNDEPTSDIHIEILNRKGELHAVLNLHTSVLREQSDYFFNALAKRAVRDPIQGATISHDAAGTTFTIQASGHVADPDAYVSTFRMFYLEEEELPDEIQCLGSVWRVLETLVVSSELQFHMCTSACVDYLESVPWNDDELEEILRLVSQLEHLQDARPILDRLPVRTWDEESISDALRILLIRAVAFHDSRQGAGKAEGEESAGRGAAGTGRGGGKAAEVAPGTIECREAASAILRNRHEPTLSLKTKKAVLRETFVDLLQCLWSEQRELKRRNSSCTRAAAAAMAGAGAGGGAGGGAPSPSPRTPRDAPLPGEDGGLDSVGTPGKGQGGSGSGGGSGGGGVGAAAASAGPVPPGALYVVKSALVGTMSAMLSKRLVANPQLRVSFVRLWLPVLLEICSSVGSRGGSSGRNGSNGSSSSCREPPSFTLAQPASTSTPNAKSQHHQQHQQQQQQQQQQVRYQLLGFDLTPEERTALVSGFNELVLTLPAHEQLNTYTLWYQIAFWTKHAGPAPRALPPLPSPIAAAAAAARASLFSSRPALPELAIPEVGGAEGGSGGGRGGGNAAGIVEREESWFNLSYAYRKWLTRLGRPC